MSQLPQFMSKQQDNALWESAFKQKQNWLDKRIRQVLKNESLAVRYTYGYLRYVDKNNRGFAYPAQATIAKAVKVSARHVIRCLARLEELQLIQRGKKKGHSYYIFTVPNALLTFKSPLEEHLTEITQEIKQLKEKALLHHMPCAKTESHVTCPSHTNKEKIIKKIKEPKMSLAPKRSSQESPTKHAPPPLSKKETDDWFNWIEKKKNIYLNKKEIEEIKKIRKEILLKRQTRFKNYPSCLLESCTYELALTSFLAKSHQILYKGPPCELLKEINL